MSKNSKKVPINDPESKKIKKWYTKKHNPKRNKQGRIKYECRQRFAVARPRHRGRFVKCSKDTTTILAEFEAKKKKQKCDVSSVTAKSPEIQKCKEEQLDSDSREQQPQAQQQAQQQPQQQAQQQPQAQAEQPRDI
eukprot:TRINITY_DN1479_c1_g1_i1.p1 TRINITY_DN1479_c1_g1~~TRINITY_DN1479_c1_g1_i1.p1  ORF type:complete len:136 (+),score=30.15 TRINITY_DN1479_c1_g1_i1:303-710(+)